MKGKRRSRQAILAAVTVLAAAHQDYEAVLVDESGTIWLTPGLKDRFIPVDQGRRGRFGYCDSGTELV